MMMFLFSVTAMRSKLGVRPQGGHALIRSVAAGREKQPGKVQAAGCGGTCGVAGGVAGG